MEPIEGLLAGVTGFEWDDGNSDKSWKRHEVTQSEAEEVFVNRPLLVVPSRRPKGKEARFFALGRTGPGRELAIVFTIRGTLLRVISARPMSRRERSIYGEAESA